MKSVTEIQSTADILIVDDTPANLQFLATMFKARGYKTRAALNGQLAIQAIQNQPPDLILMDVRMPDIDGIEVCRRIKADPALADIPVIFVSGEDSHRSKVEAFSSGGVDYITRPFQIDEVISRVSTHLDLRKQREQLRNTLLRMQELETLRDNLIHMIIHDLRNPLWAINSYLELIKTDEEESLSPKTITFLTEMQAHSSNMIGMINSILDVNKMEEGLLILNLSDANLIDLCRQAISSVDPVKQSRSLVMAAHASPINIRLDVGLIRRLLSTLISNAIRATRDEGGRITLSINCTNDFIRIDIEDNGRPIPTEEHLTIFGKHAQAHSVLNGKGRNSPGLGLPFCKLVAEAHGGHVGIRSTSESGNIFWIELPVSGPPPR